MLDSLKQPLWCGSRSHKGEAPSNKALHQTRRGGAAASRPVVARDDDVGFLSPVTDPGPWTDSR